MLTNLEALVLLSILVVGIITLVVAMVKEEKEREAAYEQSKIIDEMLYEQNRIRREKENAEWLAAQEKIEAIHKEFLALQNK